MLFSQDYREILKHEFTERVKRNPRFSLRAFAKLIGLAPARVSDILLYKKGMSSQIAKEVANALQFSEKDAEYFSTLVESLHARNPQKRSEASLLAKKFIKSHQTLFLQVDAFEMISDVNYLALIQLIKIQKNLCTNESLALEMNLSENEVENMLTRLARLELVSKENKSHRVLHETIVTPDNIASETSKNIHQQILNKAMTSLKTQSIDERDFCATVMPLNPKNVATIQKSIREFISRLMDEHSSASEGSKVYCYSSQLFKMI